MPVELTKQNVIDLTKKAEFQLSRKGLEDQKAKLKAVLDISGSMRGRFSGGTVQNVISRSLALAIPLDDDGEVDVSLFGDSNYNMPPVTLNEVEGYVKREILTKHSIDEGTYYNVALKQILAEQKGEGGKGFLGKLFKQSAAPTVPTFVLFFTDGDDLNESATEKILKELSNYPVFVQFIGIGRSSFTFLKKLNNLTGRKVDNAGFMEIEDIDSIKDSELYDRILNEFPDWLKAARTAGILA